MPDDDLFGAGAVEAHLRRLLLPPEEAQAATARHSALRADEEPRIDFFVYFDRPHEREQAEAEFAARGFAVRESTSATNGGEGLVIISKPLHELDVVATEMKVRTMAASHGGRYDGFERDVGTA